MRVIHSVIPWTRVDVRIGRGVAAAAALEAQGGLAGPASPARGLPPRRWDGPRAVRMVAALLGLAAIGCYLAIALARLTYPFTLEVLESNSLVEVHRMLGGQPLYAAPTVDYVPDGYPPAYFGVSAAGGRGARPVISCAAACVAGVVAGLLRAAGPAGSAGDRKRRRGDRRGGRPGRHLLRHRNLVRRRPGRLAVPRAQRRRPLRRAVDA